MDEKRPETDLSRPEDQKPDSPSDPPLRPQRKQSVAIYLIILFAAAFLLLLMAYFMQQRNSNAIIGNLQDSLTSFQTVDELREENQQLREQLEALEEDISELQEENEALNQQYINASNWANQAQTEAYLRNTLYVAEYLYESGDYQAAAARLAQINGDDLLIISTTSDSGVPSDSQRYETLKNALMEAGYLTENPDNGELRTVLPAS